MVSESNFRGKKAASYSSETEEDRQTMINLLIHIFFNPII